MTNHAWVSNVVILVIFLATFFFYYQPQLNQQQQEIQLLKEQLEARTRLQVTLFPSDRWNVRDNKACAVVHHNSTFIFQIANSAGENVTILSITYDASDWASKNLGPISSGGPWKLRTGETLSNAFYWQQWTQNYGTPDTQVDFSITIVTVELTAQTTTYCVIYS